jgi:hypothetical protein
MWVKYDHHGFYECMAVSGKGFCGDMMLSQNEKEKFAAEDSGPLSFYIYDGVTGMGHGCLDYFHSLKELRIADSVTDIAVSPELEDILKKNRTVIRGSFDSYAEKFSKKYSLPFMHDEIELGRSRSEYAAYIITLRFHADGRPYIRQDCITGGISPGCNGGAEKDIPLPMNFYGKMTSEDIADLCIGSCYSAICGCGKLKKFLKTASRRNGYYFTD